MKPVSGKRMCKLLKARGWVHLRTESSHQIFEHPGSPLRLAVPVHGNQDLPIGTQKSLMRDAGMGRDDL